MPNRGCAGWIRSANCCRSRCIRPTTKYEIKAHDAGSDVIELVWETAEKTP